MSKKYKGKLCVYCGKNKSSTRDHVIAGEFFLPSDRGELPQVPACEECNNQKSALEHYLTTVLPFGGRHSNARRNLETMVSKRLSRNLKLQEHLREGLEQSGGVAVPIDATKLERLFAMIAKGLAWHHWKTVVGADYSVSASVFSDRGTNIISAVLDGFKGRDRVSGSVGGDTFSYLGIQAFDDPQSSLWKLSLYGGVSFGDANPNERASQILVIIGPASMIERLEQIFERSRTQNPTATS